MRDFVPIIGLTMVAALLCLTLPLKPLAFPLHPIADQVQQGTETYTLGKGVDRLYREDRDVIGTWFDGRRKRDADLAIWISPRLVSRWLGYLEAKEKWPEGELDLRWNRLRRELGGKLTFVVRVCAMPRMDWLEEEAAAPGSRSDAQNLRFLWTSTSEEWPYRRDRSDWPGWAFLAESKVERPKASMHLEPHPLRLAERQSRRPEDVFFDDWWRRVPFGEPLTPEFERQPVVDGIALGDSYSSTWLIQVPVPDVPLPSPQFEVRVFSPNKERIARFSIFVGPSRRTSPRGVAR